MNIIYVGGGQILVGAKAGITSKSDRSELIHISDSQQLCHNQKRDNTVLYDPEE